MSSRDLANVVKRAIGDAAFRRQLQSDPHGALKGFNLSPQETAAIASGDPTKLSALGVDQRMSKAFAIGDTASSMGRQAFGSDVRGTAAGSVDDTSIADLRASDAGTGVAGSRSNVVDAGAGASHQAIIPGLEQRLSSDEDPGMPGALDATITAEEWPTGSGAVTSDGAGATGAARLVDNPPFGSGVRSFDDPDGQTNALSREADAGAAATTGGSRLVDNPPFAGNPMRDAHDRASTGSSSSVRDAHDRDTTGIGREAEAAATTGGSRLVDNPPFGGATNSVRDAHDRDTSGLGRETAGAAGGSQSDAFLTEHEWASSGAAIETGTSLDVSGNTRDGGITDGSATDVNADSDLPQPDIKSDNY